METIYRSIDKKEFKDENECRHYEYLLLHKELKDIGFYDKDLNKLNFDFSEEFYGKADIVIIHNKKELQVIREFGDDFGYISFKWIKDIGTNIWKENNFVLANHEDLLKLFKPLC